MIRPGSKRVTKAEPCKICGKDHYCLRTADGAHICMFSGGLEVPGWRRVSKKLGTNGGATYRDPADPWFKSQAGPGADPALREKLRREQEARDKKEAAYRRSVARQADRLWASAAQDTLGRQLAAAYVEARGVPMAALPGQQLPAAIRGLAHCRDAVKEGEDDQGRPIWKDQGGPALLAACTDTQGEVHALQRIYLHRRDDGTVAKRSGPGEAKKAIGSFSDRDGACRLGEDYRSGVLVLCEGVETGLALLAAGCGAVWSCISTSGLHLVKIPPAIVQGLKAVVIAGDHDRPNRFNVRPGEHAAQGCAVRLRAQYPGLAVGYSLPSHEDLPAVVAPDGSLAEGAKSADWLDVYVQRGPAVTKAGVRRGLVTAVAQGGGPGVQGGPGDVPSGGAGAGPPATEKARSVITRSPLRRARQALEECYRPDRANSGERWKLAWWQEGWYQYRGGVYMPVHDSLLQARMRIWLDQFLGPTRRGEPQLLAPTQRTVDDTTNAMRAECGVFGEAAPCWLAAGFTDQGEPLWERAVSEAAVEQPIRPQCVLNSRSGLLDVDAWCRGELRVLPHTTRWFSTVQSPIELPIDAIKAAMANGDDGGQIWGELCPTWIRFLMDMFEEDGDSVDAIQRVMGYFLTSDISLQVMPVIPGPPGSGKSTLAKVFEAVIGRTNCVPLSLGMFGQRFASSAWVGKSLGIFHDAHVGKFSDEVAIGEELKKWIVGDTVQIERKGRDPGPGYEPRMHFLMLTNETMRLRDPSGAIARRLVAIPAKRSNVGREDRQMLEKLMSELQGILAWGLFGLLSLRRLGNIVPPADGVEWVENFKRYNAKVYAFVQDCCVREPGSTVTKELLRRLFEGWCRHNGYEPMGAEGFGQSLSALGVSMGRPRREGRREPVYRGIRPVMFMEDREAPPAAFDVTDEGQLADPGFQLPHD